MRKPSLIFMAAVVALGAPSPAAARKAGAKPAFDIAEPGVFPVDYEKLGEFEGRGTEKYKYRIVARAALAEAMGAGLYPHPYNRLFRDPGFKAWNKTKPRYLNPWDYVNTGDPREDYYAWAQANDVRPGTRLFFMSQALADAGHIELALKGYHAVLVHFPEEICYTADRQYFWYVAKEALSRVEALSKHPPEVGYRLRDAKFQVINGKDADPKNDRFIIDPGHWEPYERKESVDLSTLNVIERRGRGRVRLEKYENGHWRLIANGKPIVVRGVTYTPTPVGQDLAGGVGNRWMFEDRNGNGFPDAPYDAYVDENRNNTRDPNEKPVGDFALMRDMGVNAIRIYRYADGPYDPKEFDKEVLRDMWESFGIHAIMGDFLGAYTVGSGAQWDVGTDYTDPEQRASMRRVIREYVLDHRKEPYVLMWLLGNENLMPSDYSGVNATRTQAANQVEAYLGFVNEIADMIHELDPDHPVAVGNLHLTNLADHARHAPAVDIFGANVYPGELGFGDLWSRVKETWDRPVLITEYGCDAYHSLNEEEDEDMQARYHKGNWRDIELHLGGGPEEGNAIGGVVFEYLDEWWKSQQGPWNVHDAVRDVSLAFPDSWSSEEYLGIISQGDGQESPFLRQPRKAYYLYRDELWSNKTPVR